MHMKTIRSYVITLSEDEVRKIPPGKQASVVCPKCERKFAISFGKSDESGEQKGSAATVPPIKKENKDKNNLVFN